ncbi:hypothetical protein EEB11_01975 [Pseudotabrizicola sediminis]|uniref:Flp pilus-assembly TadG-like N-terminal domain-containing protein n=1 Tax=Pseudotabrizicola sediminis TaxID=2486418 RepID=A0ABY2KUW2_9RHOB|nr:pilus assembly protein TadG-related protein [Pseudotabrizicola sediminis]TGD45342.1 hypothetical protein EEB11_01975 [Pseudotabrizicola sediminis]
MNKTTLTDFASEENGAANEFSILMLLVMLMLGAYGLDSSSVTHSRTQLQITADAAAHAALLTRERHTQGEAVAKATSLAQAMMPADKFGIVVRPENVVFGRWNPNTDSFAPDQSSNAAVRVTGSMSEYYENAHKTYLYGLVGVDSFDVNVVSTFETYHPTCLREGFVAQGKVDLRSNNTFTDGFCVHSNEYVSLNSNNYFEPGTVVSMSDLSKIDLPASGYESNEGLQQSLRQGSWNIRILSQLTEIIAGLRYLNPEFTPSYISNPTVRNLTNRNIYQEDLRSGSVHVISCRGGAAATVKNDVVVSEVVIISDCDIKFEANVKIEDAIIATTSSGSKSMSSSSGLQVGKMDNCMDGGDAQLLTLGSMDFPSGLSLHNAQLIAANNITFSANAEGLQGAALVAGGEISGTSNMTFGYCDGGMENNFHAEYFRLVE